jgi:hypothetical protein
VDLPVHGPVFWSSTNPSDTGKLSRTPAKPGADEDVRTTADREVGATLIRWDGPSLDLQSWETLEAGVGENEKQPVEVRGSHPSLEKSEGWATQLLWFDQGCAARPEIIDNRA